MNKEKKYICEKEIEFLSQLQEKEKFNYGINHSSLINVAILGGMVWIPLWLLMFSSALDSKWKICIVSGILMIIIVVFTIYSIKPNHKNMKKIENEFRCREKRIKEKYKKLGVEVEE